MRLAPKLLWSKQTSPCPISLPAYLFHQSLPAVLPLRNKPWSSCQTLSISTEQSLWVLLYVLLYKQHSSLCLFPSQCRACQPVLGQKRASKSFKEHCNVFGLLETQQAKPFEKDFASLPLSFLYPFLCHKV